MRWEVRSNANVLLLISATRERPFTIVSPPFRMAVIVPLCSFMLRRNFQASFEWNSTDGATTLVCGEEGGEEEGEEEGEEGGEEGWEEEGRREFHAVRGCRRLQEGLPEATKRLRDCHTHHIITQYNTVQHTPHTYHTTTSLFSHLGDDNTPQHIPHYRVSLLSPW